MEKYGVIRKDKTPVDTDRAKTASDSSDEKTKRLEDHPLTRMADSVKKNLRANRPRRFSTESSED